MKPNFFIVGAPKCGTTAWVQYLSTHPEIIFSIRKEPHYFSTDFPDFRWASNEEEYLANFKHVQHETCIGEASVQYLYSKVAAQNISEFCPNARIIIFLRNHTTFLRSYHNQLLKNLDEDIQDFSQAWALSGQRATAQIPETCREPEFLDYKKVGQFSEQVARYFNFFPSSKIKIVWFEDWTLNPKQTHLELLEFLGLEDDGRMLFPVAHDAKHNKINFVSKFTQRPPAWALNISSALTRLLGGRRLHISSFLQSLNTRQGYLSPELNSSIQQEIDHYYRSDLRYFDSLNDRKI